MAKKAAASGDPLPEVLLDDLQVMKLLGVKRTKLHMLMRKEGLPYIKFGRSLRFDPRKIDGWLEDQSA